MDGLPIIEVNIEPHPFAESLLKAIYHYYPIGSSFQTRNTYSGYQELLQIIEKNHTDETSLDEVNQRFLKLSNLIEHEIADALLFQRGTPFYNLSQSINIMIKETEVGDVKVATFLKLRISLLHKSWTLFFEDLLITKRYGFPYMSRVISTKTTIDEGGKIFQRIKELTAGLYPEHVFIEPRFLMTHTVGKGSPYGVDNGIGNDDEYSIYDYLYHREFHLNNSPLVQRKSPIVVLS